MKFLPSLAYFSAIVFLTSCKSETAPQQLTPLATGGSEPSLGGSAANSSLPQQGGNSATSASNSSSSSNGGNQQGGSATASGTQANGGAGTSAGGASTTTRGGTTSAGGATSSQGGSSTTSLNQGGSTPAGGASARGGNSTGSTGSTIGGTSSSGTIGKGGSAGATTTAATSGSGGAAVAYKLPPPDQCHDQDFVPGDSYLKTGCVDGDATSQCGGKCTVVNACSEKKAGNKLNADVTFMCQRNLLFSPEMEQAAADDGNTGFHYAVVGHDVDRNGIDGTDQSACCQCYQLVYAYPSPNNDRQAQLNPDNVSSPASGVTIPAPLIVQAFNTAATPTTFDVYMPAGGLGANNACAPVAGSTSQSGEYMYTAYPADGQPSQGGVKPASLYSECKTNLQWVTTATLNSAACKAKISDACNKITSSIPGLTDQGRAACIRANSVDSFYHLNWSVYAMKVECPENLTRVTGCKLAPQGLPKVKTNVTTAAQAALDKDFWAKTSSNNNLYETTTMEDCCRPSCAAINWISGRGLKPDAQYRAFYTCDAKGVPYTQPQ